MTDIGTGTYTILAQIAGEMLGLELDNVLVELGDTQHPRGPGSGGSWGAASIGSAVYAACNSIRDELAKRAGMPEGDLELANGATAGGQRLTELLDGDELSKEGHYEPGDIEDNYTASGFGAFFAQVRVNHFTGETRVDRMLGAFGFGHVLNRRDRPFAVSGRYYLEHRGRLDRGAGVRSTRRASGELRPGRISCPGEPRRA